MTAARLDTDIRIYDIVKLAILLMLGVLFGLIAYNGVRGLQPTLASTSVEAVAGEMMTLEGQGETGRIVVVQAGELELGGERLSMKVGSGCLRLKRLQHPPFTTSCYKMRRLHKMPSLPVLCVCSIQRKQWQPKKR